jgi:cysteine dioxygenase
MSFAQLLDFLGGLGRPAALPDLCSALTKVDVTLDDVRPHVKFGDRTYRRNLVDAGPWHHLLVLCWRNGQRSPIHDHQGSCCAVRVLAGTMTETVFSRAANGLVRADFSHELGPGAIVGSANDDLHQISNLQADGAELVTLHIYSPPLLIMGTYSLTDNLRGEEPMFLEFADAEGI